MYHYVHDRDPPMSEGVRGLTVAEFTAQINRLCRELEPIDWPRFHAWTRREQGRRGDQRGNASEPGPRYFLLTFDDGLADHANIVAPLLEARGLHGVFFIPGVVLTEHRMLPAHAIHLLLSTIGPTRLERELMKYIDVRHPDSDWLRRLNEREAVRMYHYEPPDRARLKFLLTMTLPIDVRNRAVEELFERHVGSSRRWAKEWYVSWDQLAAMGEAGHTIGGHGFAHEPLLRWTEPERCKDLRRAAAVLREGLGSDLRPFSYPYGSVNEGVAKDCRLAGFAQAFTTRRDWARQNDEAMLLPRVDTIDVDTFLRKETLCIVPG